MNASKAQPSLSLGSPIYTCNGHTSTAIEGNPLTLEQVRALEEGRELVTSDERSQREVLNYFAGLRFIEKNAKLKKIRHLFYVKRPNENRGARNRIDRKHVDFVLCHAGTMEPVLGIELDDSSHQRKDRQERDAFVDGVFSAAGLPLLHVPAAKVTATMAG